MGVSLTACWAAYAVVTMLILGSGALLWPATPFVAAAVEATDGVATIDADAPSRSSLLATLSRRPFHYLVCFACVHIMRLNLIVGTFREQVGALGFGGVAEERGLVSLFGALLPLGFVGMPLIGHLLDHSSETAVFGLVNGAGVLTHLLLLPRRSRASLWAAMALVATGRQFVYSTFFAHLQRLASPTTYGVLAGIANLCVAATGALQPLLVGLATCEGALGDACGFGLVNILLVLLTLLLFTQPLRCWHDDHDDKDDQDDHPPPPPKPPPLAAAPAGSMLPNEAIERGNPSTLRVALLSGAEVA